MAAATLTELGLTFTPIDPVWAPYWSAVLNGVATVPIMVVTLRMASSVEVMGEFALPAGLRLLGWLATAVMALAAIGLFAFWGK